MSAKYKSEYNTLLTIRQRCLNPANKQYPNYGGRGITVCQRWVGKGSFDNFISDLGPKPSKKHQIDRINNDLGYSPDNCRWVLARENLTNRRRFRTNKSGFKGVSHAPYMKNGKVWRAAIAHKDKDYVLGYFYTKEEAARVYDAKATKLHGKHALLNFPKG